MPKKPQICPKTTLFFTKCAFVATHLSLHHLYGYQVIEITNIPLVLVKDSMGNTRWIEYVIVISVTTDPILPNT